jgi:hypothetical protein
MVQEPEPDDSADQSVPATPGRQAPSGKVALRPERPPMSNRSPAPICRRTPPTTTVSAARSLWILSFLLGLVTVAFTYLSRDGQLDRLRMLSTELRPGQTAETLGSVAALVFWSILGALVLVIIVEALLLGIMMRQRGGARWALLAVLVIHGALWVLADAVLIAHEESELYLRLLLVAQLITACVAWVVSLLPGAAAWFRVQPRMRGRRRS